MMVDGLTFKVMLNSFQVHRIEMYPIFYGADIGVVSIDFAAAELTNEKEGVKVESKHNKSKSSIEDLFNNSPAAPPTTSVSENLHKNAKSTSSIEDMFNDSPAAAPTSSVPLNSQKNLKEDIMSLFDKVCFGVFYCSS
jgi:hypothetical protein